MPFYATPEAAGMDLLYAGYEDVILKPSERKLLPTGIAIELPEGYEAQVRPRSGLAVNYSTLQKMELPASPRAMPSPQA